MIRTGTNKFLKVSSTIILQGKVSTERTFENFYAITSLHNTLQHAATRCNTLQHAEIHRNTKQQTFFQLPSQVRTCCNTL